jgi:glycosyltransferase involved in cell wall biosynthesis
VTPSTTHLVIIPSYNPGAKGLETVREARQYWAPVWIVVDGSTDGTTAELCSMAQTDPCLRVFVRVKNGGKGAALYEGLLEAQRLGFTHALTMDSDGQHPAYLIPEFMNASMSSTQAMVLGVPVFDSSAPRIRVRGRRISNWAANLETLYAGIEDSLYGFRVYPVEALLRVMQQTRWMRRFDFDAEAVVRLSWLGVGVINVRAPVRYFSSAEGGVSHFRYWRDNVLLTSMYLRLAAGWLLRLPILINRRINQRSEIQNRRNVM